jgi:hypothetical protein
LAGAYSGGSLAGAWAAGDCCAIWPATESKLAEGDPTVTVTADAARVEGTQSSPPAAAGAEPAVPAQDLKQRQVLLQGAPPRAVVRGPEFAELTFVAQKADLMIIHLMGLDLNFLPCIINRNKHSWLYIFKIGINILFDFQHERPATATSLPFQRTPKQAGSRSARFNQPTITVNDNYARKKKREEASGQTSSNMNAGPYT